MLSGKPLPHPWIRWKIITGQREIVTVSHTHAQSTVALPSTKDNASRAKLTKTKVLEQLATSPSYQRRGIGSQLVKHGLEKADREGMVCYLSAAPMGVAVYRK